jgi:hypothetical protein
MTNDLLQLDANADAAYANSQATLAGARTQAQMANDQMQTAMLPEMGEPYLDLTGASTAHLSYMTELMDKQWARQAQTFGMAVMVEMLKAQNNPWANFLEGAMAGGQFGLPGAVMGGVAGVVGSSQGPNI